MAQQLTDVIGSDYITVDVIASDELRCLAVRLLLTLIHKRNKDFSSISSEYQLLQDDDRMTPSMFARQA